MNNEQLAGWAGGVSGFADALLGGLEKQQGREDAAAKWLAYQELQREMMGNKKVTGQELVDYATTLLGLKGDDPRLQQVRLDQEYDVRLGQAWLNNLSGQKIADTKDKGATERARIKAGATGNKGSGKSKTFKPEVTAKTILEAQAIKKGYKKGTPGLAMAKKSDLEDIRAAFQTEMNAAIQGAGWQDDIEAGDPFEVTPADGFWSSPKIKVLPGFRTRTQEKAAADAAAAGVGGGASPTPGMTPAPGPAAAPAAAAPQSKEAVGADREALKAKFRKR